jgi:hypothetical protein
MPRSVSDLVSDPRHTAALDGADAVGEAAGGNRLVVRIGLWREGGRVVRARSRASTCATLIAFAEVACGLLEAGAPPEAVSPGALRAHVPAVHPGHRDRADLVAAAARSALTRSEPGSQP